LLALSAACFGNGGKIEGVTSYTAALLELTEKLLA
jgi:hypothetical protein